MADGTLSTQTQTNTIYCVLFCCMEYVRQQCQYNHAMYSLYLLCSSLYGESKSFKMIQCFRAEVRCVGPVVADITDYCET